MNWMEGPILEVQWVMRKSSLNSHRGQSLAPLVVCRWTTGIQAKSPAYSLTIFLPCHREWANQSGYLKTFRHLVWGLVPGVGVEKRWYGSCSSQRTRATPELQLCSAVLPPCCDPVQDAITLVPGSRQRVSAVLESVTGALQSEQWKSWGLQVHNLECLSTIKMVNPIEENSQDLIFTIILIIFLCKMKLRN